MSGASTMKTVYIAGQCQMSTFGLYHILVSYFSSLVCTTASVLSPSAININETMGVVITLSPRDRGDMQEKLAFLCWVRRQHWPLRVAIVMMSCQGTPGFIHHLLRSSRMSYALFDSYCPRDILGSQLAAFLSATTPDRSPSHVLAPAAFLSARERAVLGHLVNGRSMRYTSQVLGIATKTTYTHRQNIMSKLGFSDKRELIMYQPILSAGAVDENTAPCD